MHYESNYVLKLMPGYRSTPACPYPYGGSSIENSVAPESSTLTSDHDLTEPLSTMTDSIPSVLQEDHYNDQSMRNKRTQRRAAANARDRIVATLMDT